MDRRSIAEIEDIFESSSMGDDVFNVSHKILMLGTSGVGKTAFMTSMLYGLLNKTSGLRIETDVRLKNDINNNYHALCNSGILPGTARHSEYKFVVYSNNIKLFNFEWVDYRGGDIGWSSVKAGVNLASFGKIFDFLKNSIAVFVLVDAYVFEKSPIQVQEDLIAIKSYIQKSLNDMPRGIHIVLILTKADTVGLKFFPFKRWDREKLIETCREVFSPVFSDLVRCYPSVWCDVVPISTYGKSCIKDGDDGVMRVEKTSYLRSFQVEIPIRRVFSSIVRVLDEKIPLIKEEVVRIKSLNRDGYASAAAAANEKLFSLDILTQEGRQKYGQLISLRNTRQRQEEYCISAIGYLERKRNAIFTLIKEAENLNGAYFHL